MKVISKKVVKETTKDKKSKTVIEVLSKKCHCNSFECMQDLKHKDGVTVEDDNSLQVVKTSVINRGNVQTNLKMTMKFIPEFNETGTNTIRIEKTTIEEHTEVKSGGSLKDKFDAMLKENGGIDGLFENMMKATGNIKQEDIADEIHKLIVSKLGDKVNPNNIKVIDVNKMKSFEEFRKMIMES